MDRILEQLEPSPDALTQILAELDAAGTTHFRARGNVLNYSTRARMVLISDHRIAKFGPKTSLVEAAAMEYVRQNTQIPIPRVHYAFSRDSRAYIIMDFIDAETLESAQYDLTAEQLRKIAKQLRDIVEQLRQIGGKSLFMGSWPDGPFRNLYFEDSPPEKVFTMDDFRQYWHTRGSQFISNAPQFDHITNSSLEFVLTHADLGARNILVKDGIIVAILDWETLGWYPSFCELLFASRTGAVVEWFNALSLEFGQMTPEAKHFYSIINCTLIAKDDY